MLYEFKTKLSSEQVIDEALKFFGEAPGGLGMEITQNTGDCVTLVGGGGHVGVTTSEAGKQTSVEIETREWDYQVKQFMQKLPR